MLLLLLIVPIILAGYIVGNLVLNFNLLVATIFISGDFEFRSEIFDNGEVHKSPQAGSFPPGQKSFH
jgi:hypothetical protein